MAEVNEKKEDFLKDVENSTLVIVYDCETTGLSAEENHIIQLAARLLMVDGKGGYDVLDERCWYINPGYALPEKIVELTGFTDEFLADKPKEAEVIDSIEAYFQDIPVCGYNNVHFDDKFMSEMYGRYGKVFSPEVSIDLYQMTPRVISPEGPANYKLATLSTYYGFAEEGACFHNAEFDAFCTEKLLIKVIELCKTSGAYHDLIEAKVESVHYWESRYGKNYYSRVYVETSSGTTFYMNTLNKSWAVKEKNDSVYRYNMDTIRHQAYALCGCHNEDELSLFRGNVGKKAS